MEGGKVIYRFEADDSDLKQKTLGVGDIIKGNLVSSAITSGLSKVWGGIKNITSSITSMAVQGGFDRALNIEQAEFKLKGLGHSAEEVDEIMDNALKSVKGTAYGLDEAATVAASSVAAGVQPGEDLERTLKLVGDAATISGRSMTDMGAIFNKVAASGKLTGQELNQLTDAGIPMLQLLADNLGLTTEEVQKMVSAGEIGFAEFQDAIEKGMGGAALTMGQTFSGALANTKAAMSRLGKTFMDPFMKGLTPALGTLTDIIDMIGEGTTEGIEEKTELLSKQLGEMVSNVLNTLVPLVQNAIPVITQTLTGLLDQLPSILGEILPLVVDTLMQVIKAITKILPSLIPVLMDGLMMAINGLVSLLPDILDALIQGAVLIIQSLAEQLPVLLPTLVQAIMDGILVLAEHIGDVIDCGIQLLIGLVQGIMKALPILIEKLPYIIITMLEQLSEHLPELVECGITLLIELAKGLIQAIPILISKIPEIMSRVIQAFKDYYARLWDIGKDLLGKLINGLVSGISKIWDVGKNLVQGLWNGINDAKQWVIDKIKGLGSSILKAIKGIFGIHSPSTEFEFIGKMNMLGLEQGMESMKEKVQGTIDSAFDLQPNISGGMSSTYSPQMNIIVQNNMELDPLGQVVNQIKTFSGGAKNDYNWGAGL